MSQRPEPRNITFSDLNVALHFGARRFKQTARLSLTFSILFTLIGFGLYMMLEVWQMAPISHSLAMGFMLIGPALLAGFFSISDTLDQGRKPVLSDVFKGFSHAHLGLWGFSVLSLFIFFIWLTEAATEWNDAPTLLFIYSGAYGAEAHLPVGGLA